jgi:hypothetical protein
MSAGSPSKKSGMKTRYGCSLSLWARMSAPWMVCGKKPKTSKIMRIARVAVEGPVASVELEGYHLALLSGKNMGR